MLCSGGTIFSSGRCLRRLSDSRCRFFLSVLVDMLYPCFLSLCLSPGFRSGGEEGRGGKEVKEAKYESIAN